MITFNDDFQRNIVAQYCDMADNFLRNICCRNVLHNFEQASNSYNVILTVMINVQPRTQALFCARCSRWEKTSYPGSFPSERRKEVDKLNVSILRATMLR